MDINTIREKYPQYSDLSDEALVNGLHKKYYSDIPVNEFYGKVGFKSKTAEPEGSVTLGQPNLYKEIPNIPPETTEKGKGVGIADTVSKAISSPLGFLTGEDYSKALETPVVGSLAKGVVGAKTGLIQNKLAILMANREADIRDYGLNFERAPEDKLFRIQEREGAIQGYMQDLANYGMQNKEIEAKYGKPEISKRLDEITSKPEYKDASFAAKTGLYLGEVVKNPSEIPSYIANIGLESLPQTATIVAAAYASKLGGISPGGRAAAAGGVSAFNEFGGQYAELRTQGMEHEEAWRKAAAKSGVIGLFDAVSFKSAGKAAESLLNTTAKKTPIVETVKTLGKETGKQAGFGAAGEGLGAYTIGQPLDPRVMGEEALAETASAPAAAATTYAKERIEATPPTTAQLAPEWIKDEKGNLIQKPITPEVPEGTVTLEPPQQQLGLFAPEELPAQVDQSALTEKQRAESEVERNIFALQQQEQTPEVVQQIASLQEQLPKGPGVTLDALQEEHSSLGRAYTALDAQIAELKSQRDATPKLDDKLPITEQIKNIEAQQAQIVTRSAEIGEQGDKLAKQIAPVEKTGQRELKPVSPIVGSVISKFGLAPKAPIRNAIKNLDMTDPEDRATFIDEVNKHVIKKAKIDMKAVENYLSYFEETPSEPTTNIPGAVEPSVPVPTQRVETAQGITAPIAGGMESDIGATVGIAGGEAPASTPKQGALTQFKPEGIAENLGDKSRSIVVMMPIQQFLDLSSEGGVDRGAQERADQRVSEGTQFTTVPQLQISHNEEGDAEVGGHNGRHRARALLKAGYTEMPVELRSDFYRWNRQGDVEDNNYIEKWPTTLKAQENASNPNYSVSFPVTREQAGNYNYTGVTEKPSPKATPELTQEQQQAKELFGEDADKGTALLRSGLTLDDAMKALGIKSPVAPTPTPEGKALLANLSAAGGAKPSKSPSGWFTEEIEEADKAFLGNTMGDKVKNYTGLSNILSFDDSFMNKMRDGLLELGAQGKVVMKDAVDALRRLEITQVLYRGQLATEAINKGKLVYEADSNRYHVEDDPDNMNAIRDELQKLSSRVGVTADKALEIASKGFEANRIQDVYDKINKGKGEITRTEKKIEDLQRIKQRTKAEQKDLNTKKALLENLKGKVKMYEGQSQHMSRKEAQEGMAIYNGTPEVKEIARIWQVMRERVVAELVRSGVTSEEKAEGWLDEMAYVPFFRTIEEQKASGTRIMKKGLGESMKEYAFEGSMLPVENTIGNMYQWMQWSYARAISNQHQQVALDQMRAVFPDMVKDGKHPKGNTIVIYKDGTRREYSIANPLIAQYFQGVGNMVFGTKSISSQYANLFTKGITLTPGFSASQLILKDTYEAMHTSGVKNPYGIILNIFTEMAKTALNTSEARKELISRGQLTTREHAMAAAHDADIATKLEVKEAAVHRKVIGILGKMSALSDNMLRQAVYQQLINEGVGKDEAADRATEIFNYRRASGSTTLQFVNNYVPFMNAFTVSTRVAMRTVSGKGISAQTRADGLSTLAGATILIGVGNLIYMNLVGDEDEYKRMNRFRRDKSYVIPGTGLSIPLREGWFIMDKLAAEYAYNLAENSAITDKQMFKDAMKKAAIQQITPPIGGVFTAPIGVALNKDIYANRDIVNKAQEKILPEYQFNKGTSEISKVIGKETGYSPLKIDYFLKTFFGGYMGTMATITNSAIADMRNKPRPAEENENITASALGFSSFISKQGTPNVVPDLYRAAHEVDNILPTVKSLARTDKEEARRLLEEKRNDIRIGAGTAALEKTFAALNRQESIIREMKSTDRLKDGRLATREVKKELIDKINLERESLMPKVMEARKKVFEK
jgi:hypothetical protein